jgi:hypothetical protein
MFSPTSDTRNVGYSASDSTRNQELATRSTAPSHTRAAMSSKSSKQSNAVVRAAKDWRAGRGRLRVLHVTRASLNRGVHGVLTRGP